MRQLLLLYAGTILLMYLSQYYYPVDRQALRYSRRSFLSRRADIFMIACITWMACFMFLRTSYNDSLLSS